MSDLVTKSDLMKIISCCVPSTQMVFIIKKTILDVHNVVSFRT